MEWTKVNEQSSVVIDYLEIPGFHVLLLSLVLVLERSQLLFLYIKQRLRLLRFVERLRRRINCLLHLVSSLLVSIF